MTTEKDVLYYSTAHVNENGFNFHSEKRKIKHETEYSFIFENDESVYKDDLGVIKQHPFSNLIWEVYIYSDTQDDIEKKLRKEFHHFRKKVARLGKKVKK